MSLVSIILIILIITTIIIMSLRPTAACELVTVMPISQMRKLCQSSQRKVKALQNKIRIIRGWRLLLGTE